MGKLDAVPADRLRAALDSAENAKAAKRLMVALACKDGVGVDTITSRYGLPQSTIYYWLDRFEDRPLSEALQDDPRPGRPPKLSEEQRAEVNDWLTQTPQAFGYEGETWTTDQLREHIRTEFGVQYSEAHVHRRFLD